MERLGSFGFEGGGTFLGSLELHAFAEAATVEAFQVVEGAVELAFGLAQVAAEAFQAVVLVVGPVEAVGLFLVEGVFALVVAAAMAEDDPLGGGGFADQLVEGVGVGAVVVEPAFEQLAEFVGVFVGEEEGFGAAAVLEGVLAGAFFPCFGTGATGAAGGFGWRGRRCFGFGIKIGHEASFACGAFGRRSGIGLSNWCGGRRRIFRICDGVWGGVGEVDSWFFTKRTFLRNELGLGSFLKIISQGVQASDSMWDHPSPGWSSLFGVSTRVWIRLSRRSDTECPHRDNVVCLLTGNKTLDKVERTEWGVSSE